MKTIIVDSHYLMHRTKLGLKDLSSSDQKTGVIFGFLESLLSLHNKFKPCRFIFTFDSKRSKRKKLFSLYKFKDLSKKKPEDVELDAISYPQFHTIRDEVLPSMGFKNIFFQPGYEADDIIASIVRADNDRKGNIVISRDNDLWQLLDYCSMWNPDDKILVTRETFFKEYELPPLNWGTVKILAGCVSDKVPGIERVGYGTAVKYLKKELPSHHKVWQKIEAEKEAITKKNHPLVILPMVGTNSFEIVEDCLSVEGFVDICARYNFQSHLKRMTKWRELLGNPLR